jgi:DNA ligase-1
MHIVTTNDIAEWYLQAADLAEFSHTLGLRAEDDFENPAALRLPVHLQFVIAAKARETGEAVPPDALDCLPFYSLCKGLFLPLSGLTPERIAQLFGIKYTPPKPDHEALVRSFLQKPLRLSMSQKIGCLLGDPFLGHKSTFKRDSLIRLLRSMRFVSRTAVLDRLTALGDVAALFAELTPEIKSDPPLTAMEVLETLRFVPGQRIGRKYEVLRSLFERCGKLEAYFLSKLLLRNAGFGFDYQGPLLAKSLGEHFKVDPGVVAHAMALTDPIETARVMETEGVEGLRKIQLKPLSPVRPALATGGVEDVKQYPVWVERKYDGIRLLLHKSTDARGSILCGAYTRNRGDWLELIPGLANTIPYLPCRDAIVDGELYGMVVDLDGARPASVYEVYCHIQGEPIRPVQLRYAAFDLLYLNGQDLTRLPLSTRRQHLAALVAPLNGATLPVPIVLSEGQLAENKEALNRLFHHFRAQGYEGIIAKDLKGTYCLADRDPTWVKRKPEITLDLVLIGGVLAVTSKENAGFFGSYVIAARNEQGGFDDVGDVAGVDRVRDQQIQSEIMRQGLLTGRRIERPSASGVRPGLELRPAIVATVKFEGVVQDNKTDRLSLRDPKIAVLRSDKSAYEADETGKLRELYLNQRLS